MAYLNEFHIAVVLTLCPIFVLCQFGVHFGGGLFVFLCSLQHILVSELASCCCWVGFCCCCFFSPVNHKGLYQGWKQTSIFLLAILLTSHKTTKFLFTTTTLCQNASRRDHHNKPEHNNTCFGTRLYSVGTQHRNLHQLSVTTSMVTDFILWADTETCVSHS